MPLTMEHLWDEVLSEITQYLSVDDIFACRLVCKRLEGLARHPNVWRHRRIDRACACAVLRLAPCLREIVWLAVPPPHGSKCSYRALVANKCAVESLVLQIWTSPSSTYAHVMRHQMALGRLKHVTVMPDPGLTSTDGGMVCDSLWDVLLQSSCLQSLRFLGFVPWSTSWSMKLMRRGPSKSSLVLFKCLLTKRSESFVKSVLAGHAESLEEVDLNGFRILYSVSDSTVVSSEIPELLARMARLRSLKYDRLNSVEPLAACRTLRDVTLTRTTWIRGGNVEPRDGLLKFLREANQLRALTIYPARKDNWKEMIDAVLVSLGLSLERLSFKVFKDLPLEPLVEALPQLRALRQLALEPELLEECNKLLLAITPALAPALRRLELVRPDPSTSYEQPMSDDCGHRWVHGDAVKATLTTNPMLHIHLRRPWACFDLGKDCEPCASVCHLQAGWNFRGRLVLFAHGPDNCPVPEEHTADSKWRCVHLPYISA